MLRRFVLRGLLGLTAWCGSRPRPRIFQFVLNAPSFTFQIGEYEHTFACGRSR